MNGKHPLSDSWLYWDAERLDDFPHADDRTGTAGGTHEGGGDEAGTSPRAGLLEELMLYVAGITAAVAGVAAAALIGSFISAYAEFKRAPTGERAAPTVLGSELPPRRTARFRCQEIVVEAEALGAVNSAGKPPAGAGRYPPERSGT